MKTMSSSYIIPGTWYVRVMFLSSGAACPPRLQIAMIHDTTTTITCAYHTSWASQVTAREVDWPCHAHFYVFGCDFWTRCLSCTSPQTESRPFLFFCFCPRDMTEITIRINTKATITCLEKKKKRKRPACSFFQGCAIPGTGNYR